MIANDAPPSSLGRQYHADGTLPGTGVVFVFGSNEAGRHGLGAALVAKQQFGARYGVGAGRSGMSYGIPTKDRSIRTLSLSVVSMHIDAFLTYAKANPDQNFFVSRIGCGLAGFRDSEIAPLFSEAPSNCNFAANWKTFLDPVQPAFTQPPIQRSSRP